MSHRRIESDQSGKVASRCNSTWPCAGTCGSLHSVCFDFVTRQPQCEWRVLNRGDNFSASFSVRASPWCVFIESVIAVPHQAPQLPTEPLAVMMSARVKTLHWNIHNDFARCLHIVVMIITSNWHVGAERWAVSSAQLADFMGGQSWKKILPQTPFLWQHVGGDRFSQSISEAKTAARQKRNQWLDTEMWLSLTSAFLNYHSYVCCDFNRLYKMYAGLTCQSYRIREKAGSVCSEEL